MGQKTSITQLSSQQSQSTISGSAISGSIYSQFQTPPKQHRVKICCFSNDQPENMYQRWLFLTNRKLRLYKCEWAQSILLQLRQQNKQKDLYFILVEQVVTLSSDITQIRNNLPQQDNYTIQQKKLSKESKKTKSDDFFGNSGNQIIQTQNINRSIDITEDQKQNDQYRMSNGQQNQQLISIPCRTTSLIDEKLLLPIYQMERRQFKRIMQLIEQQLRNEDNPLAQFLQCYLDCSQNRNQSSRQNSSPESSMMQIGRRSNQSASSRVSVTHSMIDDVKAFVDFFTHSLYCFYDIGLIQNNQYFTKDNISSFALNILFRDDCLFTSIFMSIAETNEEETELYYQKLKLFENESPSFFGVPDHFELVNVEHNNDGSMVSDQLTPIVNLHRELDYSILMLAVPSEEQETPYSLAIEQLKMLPRVQSPVHLLKIVCSVTEKIQYSIKKFYQTHNIKIMKKLCAEDIVPITIYIIVKSGVKHLGTYLKVIENFTPRYTLNGSAGYKLVTMQNCYHFIMSMEKSIQSVFKQGSPSNGFDDII